MNEMIKVDYTNDRPIVSARELHGFLEVKTEYRHWFPRMCEYGFTEGQDFNTVKNDRVQMEGDRAVNRTIDDAALTIDMAKEICMLQRNERGKQARQYFIQLEKDWNSPEKVMARALRIADRTIADLQAKIERDAPKVLFAESVEASEDTILIGELAKILKQNGVDTGEKRLFAWLRANGYLIKRKGRDHNMPTQLSMERGLFRIKECTTADAGGSERIRKTTTVTAAGQEFFVNLFLANVQIALPCAATA